MNFKTKQLKESIQTNPSSPRPSKAVKMNTPLGSDIMQMMSRSGEGTKESELIQLMSSSSGKDLPTALQTEVENLSGQSMDDVNVHYQSENPKKVGAHAYAQGTDIHVGPGQEKHLAHEAWHVVQQKQSRVQPTLQKKGVQINDDSALEKEADEMGAKAASQSNNDTKQTQLKSSTIHNGLIQKAEVDFRNKEPITWAGFMAKLFDDDTSSASDIMKDTELRFANNYHDPDEPIKRIEAAIILNRYAGIQNDIVIGPIRDFDDIPADSWMHKHAQISRMHGIFMGTEDNKFQPFENLNTQKRAQLVIDRANQVTPINQEVSIRSIQSIVGLADDDINGFMSETTENAVSDWQNAQGINSTGQIDETTLNLLVAERIGNQNERHEAIRMVADYYNIDLTKDTLTVYASENANTTTTFEYGNRVVEIGTNFFTSSTALRDELREQLSIEHTPMVGPMPEAPSLLNAEEVTSAISFNNDKLSDFRSISCIQDLLGLRITRKIDADFVQYIAQLQQDASIAITGQIDESTLEHIYNTMRDADNFNAGINLIIDYFDMPTYTLTSIFADSGSSNASTNRNAFGPTRVEVYETGLNQPFAGVVHTIMHELEHVRQHREGIASSDTREFLGEAVEVMSISMPEENLHGLLSDANRLLNRWQLMPLDDQQAYWARFVEVRTKLHERVPSPTGDWVDLLNNYDAETDPNP